MPCSQAAVRTLGALFSTLALAACGGGDESPAAAPAPVAGTPAPVPAAPPPPPAPTTTVAGAVVKGPVAGAQVCAYTVVANGRGTGVGSCTTSDAQGRYSFNLPVASGPLWVEASGGSYIDEVTGATATLPAGSPLTTLITANGGTVDTMLTPLTTLALNAAAAAAAGSAGTLNGSAYAAAAAQLMSSFNLPSGLNINTTLPAFGAGINSYGTALTVVSQMVANGSTLAALLATTNPQTLAAAYATAATPPAPPTTPPTTSPTGGGAITATATGSVTSTGGVEAFVPRPPPGAGTAAFTTSVSAGAEVYSFYNHIRSADGTGSSAGVATQAFTISVVRGQLSLLFTELTFDRGVARNLTRSCTLPCAGATLTRNTSGVTLSLNNASLETSLAGTNVSNPPSTPVVMNGSLTGEMPGGYAFTSQLPRATAGTLSLDGTAEPVLYADVAYDGQAPAAERLQFPGVTLSTALGTLQVSRVYAETPYHFARFTARADGEAVGLRVTPDALVSTATGYSINLAAATLTGSGPRLRSLVVNAQISVGKSSGSLAITGEAAFVPQTTLLSGNSQTITYDFRAPAGTGGFAFSSISVSLKAGVVSSFTAYTATGKSYTCDNVGSMFMAKCAGTVTVSADQRTLSFNGFKAGANLSPNANIAFDGSLTAAGL